MKKFLRFIFVLLVGDNIYRELIDSLKLYNISFNRNNDKPIQIYCLDGKRFSCGFADRLRGIITSYAFAKANRLPFRIQHEVPFKLEEYFACNSVDWILKENEKSYNLLNSRPVYMTDFTKGKRFLYLSTHRQHHFYLNINGLSYINKRFNKQYTYTELFQELFKPSEKLEKAIKPFSKFLSEGYISVSFRFMQLMGDFVDVCGYTLSQEEQKKLTRKCILFVEHIRERHPDIRYVLVTTDSLKFLNEVNKLEYVFIIPGAIGHIGFQENPDVHLKTMLDFYMISQARKVYMAYTGDMYPSHFAESAAETTNTLYESVKF